MSPDNTAPHQIDAHVSPADDGIWTIEIPTLDITGRSATFTGTTRAARALAAKQLDVDPDTINITIHVDAPEAITDMIADAKETETRGRQFLAHSAVQRRTAARMLYHQGYPYDAIGALLGVTKARARALVTETDTQKDTEK